MLKRFADFGSFFSKRHIIPIVATAFVAAVFLGGTIVGLYNRARARVPQLPAPK